MILGWTGFETRAIRVQKWSCSDCRINSPIKLIAKHHCRLNCHVQTHCHWYCHQLNCPQWRSALNQLRGSIRANRMPVNDKLTISRRKIETPITSVPGSSGWVRISVASLFSLWILNTAAPPSE